MKSTIDKILTGVLTPMSWLYGTAMWVRNKLFDSGILREVEYSVPVIGVGNLTIGGTGKTPHVEYIIDGLCDRYKVGVLSRGYKRKTRGFILANHRSTPESIGDEPWQIYNKFSSKIKVAVCESRRKGIEELTRLFPDLDVIILDDSFQHRWVKPAVSICLMEYGRPIYNDKLLPLGRLRESSFEINRADMVIVTKCPDNASQLELRIVANELNLMKFQKLYFSRYNYGGLKAVYPDENPYSGSLEALNANDAVLLLTGIAHPRYFVRHFREFPFTKRVMHFPDHHNFSRKDIAAIEDKFRKMKGEHKIIVTTEKDAVRLAHNPYFPNDLKPFIFYQPINVNMIEGLFDHDNDLIPDLKEVIESQPNKNNASYA